MNLQVRAVPLFMARLSQCPHAPSPFNCAPSTATSHLAQRGLSDVTGERLSHWHVKQIPICNVQFEGHSNNLNYKKLCSGTINSKAWKLTCKNTNQSTWAYCANAPCTVYYNWNAVEFTPENVKMMHANAIHERRRDTHSRHNQNNSGGNTAHLDFLLHRTRALYFFDQQQPRDMLSLPTH